jgi:hypothetical protein
MSRCICLVMHRDRSKDVQHGSLTLSAFRQNDVDMEFGCGVPLLTALALRTNAKHGHEKRVSYMSGDKEQSAIIDRGGGGQSPRVKLREKN